MKKSIISLFTILLQMSAFAQKEVTITIGYPDDADYFIYSITQTDENARLGGEYYVKIQNTGTEVLPNWEMNTIWKTLNSTWGVVNKTVINSSTGEIQLTGPNWDPDLAIGQSIVLNGEWIATGNIQDWIDYLPREITFSSNGTLVDIVYDSDGTLAGNSYSVQKVKPIMNARKTFASKKMLAYFPIFDIDNAWCSLQKYGKNIDELRIQLYSLNTNGQIVAASGHPTSVDPVANNDYWYTVLEEMGVFQYCIDNEIEIVPLINNYNATINDFDHQTVNTILSNATSRLQHISAIVSILNSHSEFAGIDIDYESLLAGYKDNYSLFMEELALQVHAQNKILTTAIHTKVGPGTWDGPQAQDYERIGNAVDEFTLMTYDLHWATSPTYSNPPLTAGCQATPDWINDIAFFAISEINDPSKIQIGIPFYGYRWKTGFENHTVNDPGIGLTYQDAQDLIVQEGVAQQNIARENNGKELRFQVNLDGVNWTCYFQDSTSLAYKLSALNENDLADFIGGVAIWRLGGESDEMWNSLLFHTKGENAQIENCTETSYVKENTMESMDVYPNPTNGLLHIQSSDIDLLKVIEVYTILGEKALEVQIENNSIDMKALDPGIYIVKIQTSLGMKSIPVVKQ